MPATRPEAPSRSRRRRLGGRLRWRRRWSVGLAVAFAGVLALPIPWLHVKEGFAPGTAWRLDGRLEIDGRAADPPGRWSWLTVSRPQLVGEALWDAVVGTEHPPRDLRQGSITPSPALAEPARGRGGAPRRRTRHPAGADRGGP